MNESDSLKVREQLHGAGAVAPRGRQWRTGVGGLRPLHPLAVDVSALAVALLVAAAMAGAPMSGDFGQWLMVSRFYAGEEIPDYRRPLAVAPLVPLALGLLKSALRDPILALEIVRVALVLGLGAGLYAAARALFRSRLAGLFAVVLGFGATPHVLELYAFGGLLQLAALVFLLLGVAAIASASNTRRSAARWWFAGGLAIGLAILSHAGSVVVIVPAAGAVAGLVLLFAPREQRWNQRLRVVAAASVAPFAALAYWGLVLVPLNRGYANNPATGAYRGPDTLFDRFTSDELTVSILLVGAVAIGAGVGRALATRRLDGFCLVAAWTAAGLAVLFAVIVSGTSTDYPRFTALLLLPFLVATAGAGAALLHWMTDTVAGSNLESVRVNVGGLALAGVLVMSLLSPRIDRYEADVEGYSVPDRQGLETISRWLECNLPEGQSVLTLTASHGKWIEGLTGIDTIFSTPVRFSFRDVERGRSLVADAVIRTRMALTNGMVSAKYIESARGTDGDVPREVVVTVNHDGEWVDLLRLRDRDSAVLLADGSRIAHRDLEPAGVERVTTDDELRVITRWVSPAGLPVVSWTRTVALSRGTNAVDVIDEVQAEAPVEEVLVEIGAFTGEPIALRQLAPDVGQLWLPKQGHREPVVEVRLLTGVVLEATPERRVVAYNDGTAPVHLQFAAQTAGAPLHGLALLYPPDLLAEHDVGAVVLDAGSAFAERVKRLEDAGFRPVLEAGHYTLLVPRDFDFARGAE